MTYTFEADPQLDDAVCTDDTPRLIELAPILIDYDRTVEKMMEDPEEFENIMLECTDGPIGYVTDYFPNCKEGRTGQQVRELLLFRPMRSDMVFGRPRILATIDEAGLVPEELPSLVSLMPIAADLWSVFGGKVQIIHTVGPNTLWQSASGHMISAYLDTADGSLHAESQYDEDDERPGVADIFGWIVVSRKPTEAGS